MIVIDIDLVADCLLGKVESTTINVVEVVSEVVGVPVIAPDALKKRPSGSDEPLSTLKL